MKKSAKATRRITVMKFGGTCLQPDKNRQAVLDRIEDAVRAGAGVVAVVSAMGRAGDPYATDTLEELLPRGVPRESRERDALLCCGEGIAASLVAAELYARGIPALSMSGAQLGLTTDGRFGGAEILYADPRAMLRRLDEGYVVVAAGFQGTGEDGSLTTLTRGGSDTAALAIAAALHADRVLLYKGVDGLFNADPRIVTLARPLCAIPYEEAAHLAFSGAKVLHPRAADIAERHAIPIEIKPLRGKGPGTLVTSREAIREIVPRESGIFAVACLEKIGQVRAAPDPARPIPGFPGLLFKELAGAGISLDMINVLEEMALFTVEEKDVEAALEIVRWSGCIASAKAPCAKVSLLGGGIHGVPGIMSRILTALEEVEVPVFQSVDTYTVISVLVENRHLHAAANALHRAFGLHEKLARPLEEGRDPVK